MAAAKKPKSTKSKSSRPKKAPPESNGKAQADGENPAPAPTAPEPSKKREVRSPLSRLFEFTNKPDIDESAFSDAVRDYVADIIDGIDEIDEFNILVLYDEGQMIRSDADKIYRAVQSFDRKKPVLLVLQSSGGSIAAGFLISKLCRQFTDSSFEVSVPRAAKSAATLLACGADRIHMGALSELGPIDPLINKMPALGLKNAVEHLAQLACEHEGSSELFASYLSKNLRLIDLGYYERVAESASQYAERLLSLRLDPDRARDKRIAHRLVYDYKDHGFIIDAKEAAGVFYDDMIIEDSQEYEIGNKIYEALEIVRWVAKQSNYGFYYIGSLEQGTNLIKRKQPSQD